MEERKKIKMYHKHFANIDTMFLHEFEKLTGIISIVTFIREEAYKDFQVYLTCIEDVYALDVLLEKHYYKDKSEWLREKMRNKMNKYGKEG